MQKNECIILAGGLGTRLQGVINDRPKILAPVAGRPFIDLLLQKLAASEAVSRVIMAVGYKAEKIIEYLEKNPPPLAVTYSFEESPLGTGGALMKALSFAQGQEVFALNGDSYTEVSFKNFLEQHIKSHATASLVCTEVDNQDRYGCISIDESSKKILSFKEKSKIGKGWINAGIYLIDRPRFEASFAPLPALPCSLERELFPILAEKGVISAFVTARPFIDIGTPHSFVAAQTFFDCKE
jgi:D-glycero-alpha-D-manno-heptose 1-phosphate guanylyltransferase